MEYLLDYQDEMQINDIKTTFLINFLNYLENNLKNSNKLSKRTKITYLRVLTSFFISDNNDDLFLFSFDMKKLGLKLKKQKKS
ncbi:phage integrase SAM-like domain-containing protein [Campylobacter coli]|uniref:phage integrase SAM-like domain-containing protein n=1 Tax=Campylobacter coli TaxID=195 RepID=UPI001CB784A6|nr:phage integrase SAM-like domain-containing protein [Campylobacter coli]